MKKSVWKYYGIALVAVLLDQVLKLWVHFNMQMGVLGQIKLLDNWFKLFYTLNPGMAFGIQFGFKYDKILLTVIRIIATAMIIRYIWQLSKHEKGAKWLLWGWALVLGGAAGNGIDSIFYGKLLANTPYGAPMSWFYGQVIDMLYIDIWTGRLPNWVPWFSGNFVTCLPVFNLADVAILAGVALIILGKKDNLQQPQEMDEANELKEAEPLKRLTELPEEITDHHAGDIENQ
ncbi:MAG: lipoprotein signal peptidase [Candidatus Amoebophilus sp. 36-38]|nr:MAG: lipoprotein signal peptidase [Candidatus Amoebophilus sp. 36-38]